MRAFLSSTASTVAEAFTEVESGNSAAQRNAVRPVSACLGLEDQVLLHLIVESGIEVDFVTLDTGRLFPETYDLWARRGSLRAADPRLLP